jgi:hypothetical protein
MIDEAYPDGLGQQRDPPRDVDVGLARFGRTRRMIVREQHAMRANVEGA